MGNHKMELQTPILVWACIAFMLSAFSIAVDGRHHHHHHYIVKHGFRSLENQSNKKYNIINTNSTMELEDHHGEIDSNNATDKRAGDDKTKTTGTKQAKNGGAGPQGAAGTSNKDTSKEDKTDKSDKTDAKDPVVDDLNIIKFEGKQMAKTKSGADAVLKGVEEFYGSYKKGDSIGVVISTVGILAGFSSMVGGPVGYVVAMGLSVLKTALTIIDQEFEDPVESEVEKMEKMIKEALDDFRESELQGEWSGYERLADLFLKNVEYVEEFHSIASFAELTAKEKGQEKWNDDINSDEKLKSAKQKMFEAIVPRMYDVLMESNRLIGKVEYEISQACDKTVPDEKVNGEPSTEKDEIEEDSEKEKFAKRCLGMYELYSKISYYREITYIGNLYSIAKIIKPQLRKITKTDKNPITEDTRTSASVYMRMILNVLSHSTKQNKKVFYPFVNPFNNYKMRYSVNYHYTYSKKYEYLSAYVNTLDFTDAGEDLKELKDIMICDRISLTGSCQRIKTKPITTLTGLDRLKSMFVPKGTTVRVYYTDNGERVGPMLILGPDVLGSAYNVKHDEKEKKIPHSPVSKLTFTDTTGQFVDRKYFKMCVAPEDYKEGSPPYHRSVCTTRALTKKEADDGYTIDINSQLKARTGWYGNYFSIASEESDLAFVGTAEFKVKENQLIRAPDVKDSDKSLKTMKVRWGPFFSPREMATLGGSALWDKISVYRYKNSKESDAPKRKAPADDPDWCKENLLCGGDVIDESLFVTICKDPNMKGYCEEVPYIKGASKTIKLTRVNRHITLDGKDVTDEKESYAKFVLDVKLEGVVKKKVPFNDEIDECGMFPRFDVKVKSWENLIQSMKVPKNISAKLMTNPVANSGKWESYGPYDGPVTVQRIDGNMEDSNLIGSIEIQYTESTDDDENKEDNTTR